MSRICPIGAGNIPRVHAGAARSRPGKQVGDANGLDRHRPAPEAGAFAAVQKALGLGGSGAGWFGRAGPGDRATRIDAG